MCLAELRNNKKISQKELAAQIGYSQNMISQWEMALVTQEQKF
jgi:transcriptional regulator with XRE-family HTH domain